MAKRRRGYKISKCPEPLNSMLDFAGALTLGLYTRHKIKKDFEKGEGEESINAASMAFALSSLGGTSKRRISFGGMLGLNSAIKDIEKKKSLQKQVENRFKDETTSNRLSANKCTKMIWRNHCEDGTKYGISPNDYKTADEYNDALAEAKYRCATREETKIVSNTSICEKKNTREKKYVWRKYCEDGSDYGVNPMDYENADSYEEALNEAKKKKSI